MTHQTFSNVGLAERLRTAREAQYGTSRGSQARAAEDLSALTRLSVSTYIAQETGKRTVKPEALAIYARHFKVTTDWLYYGGSSSRKMRDLNQLTQNYEEIPSHNETSGITLPVLDAKSVDKYFSCQKNRRVMKLQTMPVPQDPAISERAFIWRVPEDDFAMSGTCEIPIHPGAYVIIEPVYDGKKIVADPKPGDILFLSWGKGPLTLRRYQGALPFSAGKTFRLTATHPDIEPLMIKSQHDRDQCIVRGIATHVWQKLRRL